MGAAGTTLSESDKHCLFEGCIREAERIGGDERTAKYFYLRAQSSRVWLSSQGAVTIADMDIADWCGAIAWSAPGVGRPPKSAEKRQPVPIEPIGSDAKSRRGINPTTR